ncbi:MAG TPA: peptidase MA family metallohydrolase [Anaerolineae bacterium]
MKRKQLQSSMFHRPISSLFLLLGFLLLWPSTVVAQTEASAFSSTAGYDFGQRLRFYLTAEASHPIERATLFFRASEFANTLTVDVPVEQKAGQLEVTHAVDLTQVRLAPFTTVTFWWVLATEDGQDIIVPEQSFVYEDDQFEWRTLTQEGVTVHWTDDSPGLGQLALDIVAESWPQLHALMPVTEEMRDFDIYIYPSSADLRAALRLTGRDWVGAHADPALGVILVTAVNSRTAATDLRQSIPHELVHFLLYQITGPAYGAVPLWFNEGLATLAEKTPNPNYETVLATAVADRATIPFAELCHTFPATEEQAVLAYAQSLSLVRFIQANYGNQALGRLVAAFSDGANCETAVQRTLQLSLAELNQVWLRDQQPRSQLFRFLEENTVWLLLIFGSFAITTLLVFTTFTSVES